MATVNPMSFAGKSTVLDVVRTERQAFSDLVNDPKNWNVQTRCTEWKVGDMVGHMIDVTEGYLNRWEKARKGEAADVTPLTAMAEMLNKGAQSFRKYPRAEVLARWKSAYDKMMATFESLSEDQWSNFIVTHGTMGPLPTFFYPAFHVMDYGVHTWDIRYGLGEKTRKLNTRTAGVLVPYMLFALNPYTIAESAKGWDLTYGLDISSEWGGNWRDVQRWQMGSETRRRLVPRLRRHLRLRPVRFCADLLWALRRRRGARRPRCDREGAPSLLRHLTLRLKANGDGKEVLPSQNAP